MKPLYISLLFLLPVTLKAQETRLEAESFNNQSGTVTLPVTDEGRAEKAVGYWNKGDFISFYINPHKAGTYLFTFRLGTNINDAVYELRDEKDLVLATVQIPNTGSHGTFMNVTATANLAAGKQLIKWVCASDNIGADINWLSYRYSHETGAPELTMAEDTVITITDVKKNIVAQLRGSAKDDGQIVSYQWKKLSGSGAIGNAATSATTVSGLAPGENVFQLTVTDNEKKSTTKKITILVKKCSGRTIAISPVAGSGSGISMEVPGYGARKVHYPDPGYNPAWNFPKIKVSPGDTIALKAQYHWSYVELYGVEGAPGCPVVITSDSGTVHIDRGIKLVDAQYVKLTGRGRDQTLSAVPSGSENFKINIRGTDMIAGKKGFGAGGIAIEIIGRSAHIEVDMIRAERKGYGVQAKQDQSCDTMYNYPNWTMNDIHIHHCYFRDILQDVLYLGNTDPLGTRKTTCGNVTNYYKPIRLAGFNIHHNRILLAGRTGIQLGGAETGRNEIHHNYVSDCGYEFNQEQGAGISIGGMSRNVHVYDNIVKRTFLYGIFDLGADSSFVYNNFVDSSGYLDIALFNQNMSADSLAAVLHTKASGKFLLNLYQNGITNIQSTTKDTKPKYTKTVFYLNNVLGANTSKTDPKGIISFSEWGPAVDWTENSVVCGNTRANGEPVTVETYSHRSKKWPVFSESCDDSPLNKKPGQKKKAGSSKQKEKISGKLIAGGAISLAAIAVIYLLYKRMR